MSLNLPPILSGSSPRPNTGLPLGGVQRAQNLATTKLQQKIERENAAVSINQALSRAPNTQSGYQKSTSIHHLDGSKSVISAVTNDRAKRSVYDTEYYDEEADKKRHDYVLRLIAQRKKKEKQAVEEESGENSRYAFGLKGGKNVKVAGASGLHKQLGKFFKKYRGSYSNLSSKDKAFFEGLVTQYAKHKSTGSSFGFSDKRRMRWDVEKARRQGTITYEDARDFKKLIDNF